MTLTWADVPTPPAGRVERFGGRWRLVAAGLSNVWRYGDLDLDAASGRLLLRGPNGTGKTTALEVLWPYLLDLNAALLGAGKARNTHLSQLMREAADGRRRIGFVWLTFAGPGDTGPVTYGVRLNYSKGSTPEVKVAPFTVPGRVLHDVALWGTGRASFSPEQFDAHLAAHGGTVFHSNDDYVRDLAARVFDTDPAGLVELARRIREVRNPALLGVVSPQAAAEALKVALPGVAEDTIDATGEALAESDATRAAFEADRTAAETLSGFARVWIGHAADVAATYRQRAVDAVNQARRHANDVRRLDGETEQARSEADTAKRALASLQGQQQSTGSRLRALERSDEYRDAGRLTELAAAAQSLDATAQAKFDALTGAATQAARLTDADAQAAEYLTGDIADVLEPVARDVTVPAATSLFHTAKAARPALHVGDTTVDAGVALSAAFDDAAFDSTVATLTGRADGLAGEANRARLYLQAHEAVAADETEATKARAEAERLARTAEEAARMEKAKAAVAAVEVAALAELLAGYAADIDDDCGWDPDTLADIDWTDPPAALADADELASTTSSWAHGQAAAANARAASLTQQANGQRVEAEALRAEATRLRDHDVLLPLPRPDWAGESDDDTAAFGAAVDWVDGVDSTTQDTVEAVLAAAGVLGATLHAGGARTAAWAVDATGPVTADNLAALLRPDTDHPLADVAARVLERVTLAPTALDSDRPGLIIGLDGTFRAGILAAAVPDARDRARRRPAAHIGARRRRDAALAHAARLGAQAAELNTTAAALDEQGAQETAEAERVVDLAGRFPNREALRSAESARAAAAAAAEAADQAAAAAETHADELTAVATEHRRRWTTDVIDAGLPADAAKLSDIVTHAAAKAQALRSAAQRTRSRTGSGAGPSTWSPRSPTTTRAARSTGSTPTLSQPTTKPATPVPSTTSCTNRSVAAPTRSSNATASSRPRSQDSAQRSPPPTPATGKPAKDSPASRPASTAPGRSSPSPNRPHPAPSPSCEPCSLCPASPTQYSPATSPTPTTDASSPSSAPPSKPHPARRGERYGNGPTRSGPAWPASGPSTPASTTPSSTPTPSPTAPPRTRPWRPPTTPSSSPPRRKRHCAPQTTPPSRTSSSDASPQPSPKRGRRCTTGCETSTARWAPRRHRRVWASPSMSASATTCRRWPAPSTSWCASPVPRSGTTTPDLKQAGPSTNSSTRQTATTWWPGSAPP